MRAPVFGRGDDGDVHDVHDVDGNDVYDAS
jgi:hypothetical protein